LWAGPWAAGRKITVSGIPFCLHYCKIFVVYTQITNVGAGCILQPGRPQVGDPITKVYIQQKIIDFDVCINTSVCR